MILLIDNYDSFTYNLYQAIEFLGYKCKVVRNDAITTKDIPILNPAKIIISPGPGEPTTAGISIKVVETFSDSIPILGVCLGHQSIGQAFGARIVRSKRSKHGKLSKISHNGSGIYRGLQNPFDGARYHSLIIERETLPSCLEITAQTDDGVIMGVKHREYKVEGVQFHPESVATQEGIKLIKNFLRAG